MKTEGAVGKWGWRGARALALGILVCGLAAGAQTRVPVEVLSVTTPPISGAVGDTVLASVVDTGLRTGATVHVTLRLLNRFGAVVAETSGNVNANTPLRLSHQATSTGGLSAQVTLTLGGVPLSAPVLTVERWDPAVRPTSVVFIPPETCLVPTSRPDDDDGPVTLAPCPDNPRCTCQVEEHQ